MNSNIWQGGTAPGGRPFFNETAREYQDVRPGYDSALVERVLHYAGRPAAAAEIGAGTGKATEAFVAAGLCVRCVEPDASMAAQLTQRFGRRDVIVDVRRFEEWEPAEPPLLIYAAQSWHWLDSERRCARAASLLARGGALALFGHRYLLADPEVAAAVDPAYMAHAPHLLGDPEANRVPAARYWYTTELAGSGWFVDVEADDFSQVIRFDVETYLRLVSTFSSHRVLGDRALAALIGRLRRDFRGLDHIDVELATVLTLARRPSHDRPSSSRSGSALARRRSMRL
ncbi:hypothetical protein AB0F68_06905 [Micromonospora sp. NPDC023966]|uniref:class I SAM-dependent methyltransferase n=1 Tax=Micromonospora sp. NPDC023966 TaxID=3154699 RepID=UPI0033C173F8